MRYPVRLLRAIEPPDPQRRQARALPSTASERLDDQAPRCRSASRCRSGHGVDFTRKPGRVTWWASCLGVTCATLRPNSQCPTHSVRPPADPQLTEAEEVLANFGSFWDREEAPAERHRLLSNLFEHIWQDKGRIVFVRPRSAFVPYFQVLLAETAETQSGFAGVRSGSDGTRTRDLCRDRAAL
jgi:hypothetical protein